MRTRLPLVLCILTSCASTGLAADADRRAKVIAGCIAKFHEKLVKLGKSYPQLEGIEKVKPSGNTLSFQSGTVLETKKKDPEYSHDNACRVYLRLTDVKGTKLANLRRGMPADRGGVRVYYKFLANPKGEKAKEFGRAVNKAHEESLEAMHKKL